MSKKRFYRLEEWWRSSTVPLCDFLPNISGWVKNFDDAKTVSSLVNEKNYWQNIVKYGPKFKIFLKKKKEKIRRKKFDSDPVFDKKYLKTKTKSYKGRISTNFNDEVLKEGSECIFLSLIVIDFVFQSNKNYYSH